MDYERRHGYRGPEGNINLPANADDRAEAIEDALVDHPDNGELALAVVPSASPKQVVAQFVGGDTVTMSGEGLRFVAAALRSNASKALAIKPGSIIRVSKDAKDNWQIAQLPQVEGALVSMVPQAGAIRSLVGGFDFNKNKFKFNHITQALRQPGSSFKPFIYSAALDKGLGRRPSSTMRRCISRRRRPAGMHGSRRTTISPTARYPCASACRSRRTSCRSAFCRTSARSTRRISSRRTSASTRTRPALSR